MDWPSVTWFRQSCGFGILICMKLLDHPDFMLVTGVKFFKLLTVDRPGREPHRQGIFLLRALFPGNLGRHPKSCVSDSPAPSQVLQLPDYLLQHRMARSGWHR